MKIRTRSIPVCILGILASTLAGDQAWGQRPLIPRRGGPPEGAPIFRAGDSFRMAPPRQGTPQRDRPSRPNRIGPTASEAPRQIRQTAAESTAPQAPSSNIAPDQQPPTLVDAYDQAMVSGDAPCFDDGFSDCNVPTSCVVDGCSPDVLFSCCTRPVWSLGVELTFLKPHWEDNPAFTTLEGNGGTRANSTVTQFDYDRELAPRIWLEALQCHSLGFRAVYWQFDHSSRNLRASPPANGLGRISHPAFGAVDLSTSAPNSTFATSSALNAYAIDLEGTQSHDCGAWGWMASAGLRFAEADQQYRATLQSPTGVTQGTLSFHHMVQGFGPTVSLRTQRPFSPQFALFGFTRGSLLYGDGESRLNAIEDQDLDTALTTTTTSNRDDLLPIGELQAGLQWTPPCYGIWHPYMHVALEGQLWGGAGNASSTQGNLGFFGFNVALGIDW